MRIRSSLLSIATALLLATSFLHSGAAQVPESNDVEAQTAAIALTSEDLPTGYILTGETFLPVPDAGIVPGVQAHYVSLYTNVDNGQQIRSYVYLFDSADSATAGIDVIEGNEEFEDAEVELGDGNAEISTGTYQNAEGATIGTADVTFVRGNAVVGVAVDNPDGTVPDSKLATDLAARADSRAQQVQAGESTLDLNLPKTIVPITDNATVLQSGYLSAAESEAVYGTQGSALTSLTGTYVQTVAYGEEGIAPRVTIGVSTYASADEAAAVVTQADLIFQPLADQEKIEEVNVDGADSAVAYRYTSRDGAVAETESFRLIVQQGETVTVIDVQGAADGATAESAAMAIAAPQLTCQTSGECVKPVAVDVIPQ